MSFAPTLTASDSGIRLVAPVELTEELHRHFSGDGIECAIFPGDTESSRKIVFLSPYAIDKIIAMFNKWEEERATG